MLNIVFNKMITKKQT